MKTALLSIAESPLSGAIQFSRPIPAGMRISDIIPTDTPGAMVRVDGEWILRAQWGHEIQAGQHLEVHCMPAGNDGRKVLRIVLTIAAAIAFGPAGLGAGEFGITAAMQAGLNAAAQVAINALLPMKMPNIGQISTNDVSSYATNLAGNRAALNSPIPVLYGRNRAMPPFAAEPYQEYDDENDQYFHALLCVGMGEYEIESLQLDDTELDHFNDVEFAVLPPGTPPTIVLANVVSAAEVADLELNAGRASPAIAACRGGLIATHVGFDIVFPGGLGDAGGSSVANYSVDVRFDWRPLDNWGQPTGPWVVLATETITDNKTSPVRRSFKYELDTPSRPEVRVTRATPRDDDPLIRNEVYWTGLRAYLDQTATLAAGATYVEVKMRATEQLNGLTQRRLAVISRRLLNTWHPDTGWTTEPAFTRNPAWAIVDKLRDSTYGNGLPDSRIDLDTFYALSLVWAERQDNLDVLIDTLLDSDEADQIMARAGRARCFWRNGVRTLVRDEAQTMPAAVFSGRDITPGSVSLSYATDASRVPDGIIIEYFSHQTWEWGSITCPAPGVVTPTRPEYMRIVGITGSKHAEREGLYEAAARVLRRKFCTITTELQGLIPSYGSAVVLGLPLRGWGQHGDVVAWNPATLEMTLTEPADFTGGSDRFITLQRPDGSVCDSIAVTAGETDYTVVLAEWPDFDPITDDARRERTRFVFGTTTEHRRTMLVLGIRPQEMREDGAMLVQLSTVNDDAAIHAADNALLPEPEEIQDPIDSPNEDGPGGEVYIAYLRDRNVSQVVAAAANEVGFRLLADGTAQQGVGPAGSLSWTTISGEWLLGGPYGVGPSALFEIRATETAGGTSSGTVGTWLAGDSAPAWTLLGDPATASASIFVEIRDAATDVVQVGKTITLSAAWQDIGGGE